MERYLEDPLADALLGGIPEGAGRIRAVLDNQKVLLFPEAAEPAPKPRARRAAKAAETSAREA